MTDRELMQQALDALEYASDETKPEGLHGCDCLICEAIPALRDRLAQPEQKKDWQYVQQLNAFSYPSQWVGLDDEEYQTILGQLGDGGLLAFYILIESKLKEKNT